MFCVSVSYKKTPLAIREKFAFSAEEQRDFLAHLMRRDLAAGAVVVSTCNRTELYMSGTREQFEQVIGAFADTKHMSEEALKSCGLFYGGSAAVRHLFRVCAGLDSMVPGEDEILRQVKEAYLLAAREGYADGEINILFQGAFHGAKQAKSKTVISTTPLSVGTLTANEIEQYLAPKKPKQESLALVIGATGKIGGIVAKDLLAKGISVIGTTRRQHGTETIVSRGQERMQWVGFSERYQYMEQADVIVSATISPHYTVTKQAYLKAVTTRRPRLLIDLAVPGDMDRGLADLPGVTLLDIDFFRNASRENRNIRRTEMEKAGQILEDLEEDTLKKLYLSKFKEKFDGRSEEWFVKMIYYLKEVLNSEQFLRVLANIYAAETGEKYELFSIYGRP